MVPLVPMVFPMVPLVELERYWYTIGAIGRTMNARIILSFCPPPLTPIVVFSHKEHLHYYLYKKTNFGQFDCSFHSEGLISHFGQLFFFCYKIADRVHHLKRYFDGSVRTCIGISTYIVDLLTSKTYQRYGFFSSLHLQITVHT